MFAQLGDIKFELITYFNGLTETMSYNYAQHERIENLKLNFHRTFCVPEDEIKNLVDVADKATPLKYIKGNGEYVGVFVIEEIGQVVEQASPEGDLLSIQVDVRLREYTGKIPEEQEEQKGFKKK